VDDPPLADAADLAIALGVPVGDERLNQALVESSNRFRGAVRHYVSKETRTVTLDGRGYRALRLPSLNVDPASVVVDVDDGSTPEVMVSTAGVIARRDGAVFPVGFGNVTVTYDAGYPEDAIPGDIQAAVIDQAKVIYTAQRGVQSMQVGGISLVQSTTDTVGVTQQWVDVVAAYRIRVGDRA